METYPQNFNYLLLSHRLLHPVRDILNLSPLSTTRVVYHLHPSFLNQTLILKQCQKMKLPYLANPLQRRLAIVPLQHCLSTQYLLLDTTLQQPLCHARRVT
jgi:hypothetical protein